MLSLTVLFSRHFIQNLSLWPRLLPRSTMSCRDIHATNAFSFIIALLSVGGIAMAALIPQWRITTLVTFNRNAKNVSVYDGLWAKCVKRDDNSGCYYYDTEV